jgi:multidrug efflux pump subunit AcrA (membrane-fusion protein)
MAFATLNENAGEPASAASDDIDSILRLQREMLQQASSAPQLIDLLRGLAKLLVRHAEPVAIFYFERNAQGDFADAIRLRPTGDDARTQRFARQLMAACQSACHTGEMCLRRQAAPARVVLAAPIALRNRDPDAFGVIFSSDQEPSHLVMLVQMVVSHIVLWHVLDASRDDQTDMRHGMALVELLDQVITAPNLRQACYTLAGELESYLQCKRVALGLRLPGTGRCRLVAVSGVSQFDKRSTTAHALEATMNEVVLRQDITVWPALHDQQRHAALAHKHLCLLEDTKAVVSTPLRDDDGNSVGALIVLDDAGSTIADAERFLRAGEASIAASLAIARRLEGGHLARLSRAVGGVWRTWKSKAALAAIVLASATMLIPLPYKVRCNCQIEPVTRRFVAAPFEGTLEKSLFRPGDMVGKGDVLARMDGREVRWKRSIVVTDQDQAIKRRDSAQATHNYADQQIAELEVERLGLELQLLSHREENLEIKSPVDGIVVSGDLERAEGAPLTIGQTLLEIAPLESMIVEVAVPDDEISHVAMGQTIELRLDAYPGQVWQASVANIHSRAEIRDGENIFVAEAELVNTDSRLRPGMKGRAKVETHRRPLGWILFHKPWDYVTKELSW